MTITCSMVTIPKDMTKIILLPEQFDGIIILLDVD